MDKAIIEEAMMGFKIIVESENIKLIFTCPDCGAEHNLAELIALIAENKLKELPNLACLYCHCTFDLSETKEFEDLKKNFFLAFVSVISKMKNISEEDGWFNQFVNSILEQK